MKEEQVKKLQERAEKETNLELKKAIEDKVKQFDKTITK